jgi:hypothetical protein
MTVIAYITEGRVVKKILEHLSLPTELPAPEPKRRPSSFEEQWPDEGRHEEQWEVCPIDEDDSSAQGLGRGPEP